LCPNDPTPIHPGLESELSEKDAEIQGAQTKRGRTQGILDSFALTIRVKGPDMKNGFKIILMALAFMACAAQARTNYTVAWFTIDGGGNHTREGGRGCTIGNAAARCGSARRHFVFDGGARKGEKKLVHEI
jgi:hypothetical protein